MPLRVYQAFRWWGVGTSDWDYPQGVESLSSIPMVGCRNSSTGRRGCAGESIKHSDGGVSEQHQPPAARGQGVYQAFRWWGVGTSASTMTLTRWSLSSIPMVGCRNSRITFASVRKESIKHSDGGVSELIIRAVAEVRRVYQAFRWWGVGTCGHLGQHVGLSLSSIPMVGCRNGGIGRCRMPAESIKHSDGGVSELMS